MGSSGLGFIVLGETLGAVSSVAVAGTTASVVSLLPTRPGVAIEFEELEVWLPLFFFCRRDVLLCLLAMVSSGEKA